MSWILITGAAKNLGSAIAYELAKQGHHLVIHAKQSQQEAETIAQQCRELGVRALTFFGDVEDKDFIRRYLDLSLDTKGLVNNIGNYSVGPPSAIEQDLKQLMGANLLAPLALTQALLPQIKSCRGCVVNIGAAGLSHPWTHASAYGLTKAALLFYTRSLAKEVANEGVRVNMVSPGYLEHTIDMPTQPPMGRLGTSQEVASMVAYLFSEKGAYVTGQNLEIAGGVSL
ncbi:MAG: SDR family oxidoreductase [Verrucomicrobia bacterium]|nr:SDR family oxidoreductase [Verrucomicrobiota bacterium]MBS0646065.1 SDR family oxidoreductase [Verrucomicrobiota bacterium]